VALHFDCFARGLVEGEGVLLAVLIDHSHGFGFHRLAHVVHGFIHLVIELEVLHAFAGQHHLSLVFVPGHCGEVALGP